MRVAILGPFGSWQLVHLRKTYDKIYDGPGTYCAENLDCAGRPRRKCHIGTNRYFFSSQEDGQQVMETELLGPLLATGMVVGAIFYLFQMLQASDAPTPEKISISSEEK